jgi:hypothetical protein
MPTHRSAFIALLSGHKTRGIAGYYFHRKNLMKFFVSPGKLSEKITQHICKQQRIL